MRSMGKVVSSAWQAAFGDPVRAFGVVSLILLLTLAIAPAKDHFSQWHSYQRKYLALIRDRGDAVSLRLHDLFQLSQFGQCRRQGSRRRIRLTFCWC